MEKTCVGSFEGSWHKIHKCFCFPALRSHVREKAWNCVADQWMHLRFKLSDKKETDDWWVAAEWLLIILLRKRLGLYKLYVIRKLNSILPNSIIQDYDVTMMGF